MLGVETRPRGATCGKVDRRSLHLGDEGALRPLIYQCRVFLKPGLIVQYYLDGMLVALEISELLTFLTAFLSTSSVSRRIKKGEERIYFF